MIKLLSEQITDIYMNDVECLGKNEYLKIKYGMELLLSTIAMVIVLGIVGAITQSGKDILIFSSSFCILRLFSGGWHAKSHYKCIFVFVAVNLVVSFYLISIINLIHMNFEPVIMGMMFRTCSCKFIPTAPSRWLLYNEHLAEEGEYKKGSV